jgi:hypothetical protein
MKLQMTCVQSAPFEDFSIQLPAPPPAGDIDQPCLSVCVKVILKNDCPYPFLFKVRTVPLNPIKSVFKLQK